MKRLVSVVMLLGFSACGMDEQKPVYTVGLMPDRSCVYVSNHEVNGWGTTSFPDEGEENISGVYCKEAE